MLRYQTKKYKHTVSIFWDKLCVKFISLADASARTRTGPLLLTRINYDPNLNEG